jgi:hypothetical protein
VVLGVAGLSDFDSLNDVAVLSGVGAQDFDDVLEDVIVERSTEADPSGDRFGKSTLVFLANTFHFGGSLRDSLVSTARLLRRSARAIVDDQCDLPAASHGSPDREEELSEKDRFHARDHEYCPLLYPLHGRSDRCQCCVHTPSTRQALAQ